MGVISSLACEAAVRGSARSCPLELVADKAHPFVFFKLEGLTWIDWATVTGLILTVVGFGITWWQLHRTRTARQAVNETRSEINRKTASTRLSQSLPSLRTLYAKARSAAYEKDKQQLRQRLEEWSGKCGPAITMLEQLQAQRATHRWKRTGDDQVARVVAKLRSAQSMVGEALRKMDDQPDMVDLESGLQYALTAMREFSDLAAAMVEENRYLRKAAS
ncbi:MAG TPA: hypothetical protein VII22_25745 [Streptosporangiaceae bacterium]